jgi:holin-like protein
MVQAFAILLLCQLVGEGIVHLTAAPVPGPVIGLVVLAAGLAWRERYRGEASLGDTPLGRAANGLLGHLSLLFVPAAVGIVQQGGALAANGLSIIVALVVSTILTLAVTAAVFVWAARRYTREPRP